ncbi:MAG TPA: ATP-binding cassette domain-containing protein [Solirubrobacteraceae bacterium]|nr:ATP-binding cassette domain-containing protein [Solirubrobacteraceae bacterium]
MSVTEMRAEDLTLVGGETVLVRQLDLRARAGSLTGVTGVSGSGKTTLLYALGGLIAPAHGRVLLDGRPAVAWRDAPVGMIFQNLCLVSLLSAQETVALPLQARGLRREEIFRRAAAALEALGLTDHAPQLIGDLSGGQRQRVAVARVLASEPDVVLADEPTAAIDEHWRDVVRDLLRAQARRGAVVVIASSDPEVTAACDELVTLQ